MKPSACCALILLLPACDAIGIEPAEPAKLQGEWDWNDGYSEFPAVCGSAFTIRYYPEGYSTFWGETGTWRLVGTTLTYIKIGVEPSDVDRSYEDFGRPLVSTLRWIDRNTFVKRYADGEEKTFRRCPDQP